LILTGQPLLSRDLKFATEMLLTEEFYYFAFCNRTDQNSYMRMGLNKIHILPTEKTPEIILDPEGIIKISGRSLVLNKTSVSEQMMNWIERYLLNPAESTEVIIALDYLNSFGTKNLILTLQQISKVILQNKKYIIHWHYEEDDEDILERGEYISSTLKMPVEFILTKSRRPH
jgi:hypothetical protein